MYIDIRLTEDQATVVMRALKAFAEVELPPYWVTELSGEPEADLPADENPHLSAVTAIKLYKEASDKLRDAKSVVWVPLPLTDAF